MKIEILVLTTLRVGLLLFFFNSFSQYHPLIKYYNGELKLTEKQVDSLVIKTLNESDSRYLLALAYYQKGVLLWGSGEDIEEFKSYASAFAYLQKSDTTDNYLMSAILGNQGTILHNYKLYEEAVELYRKALDPSYEFSFNQGVNTEYNIALAMMQYDPKNALALFADLKKKISEDFYRQAMILNQIGIFHEGLEEYNEAISNFESGLELGVTGRIKASLIQNISDTYYLKKDYINQEKYLRQVLEIPEGNHFLALVDLGECYILQGRKAEALRVLLKAEVMYDEQSLRPDHIKVFQWLRMISNDPVKYADRQVEELTKYIDRMDKLKDMMKTLAMKNVLVAEESEQRRKKDTSILRKITILLSIIAIAIFLIWRIWLNRLRSSLSKKIVKLVEKSERDL